MLYKRRERKSVWDFFCSVVLMRIQSELPLRLFFSCFWIFFRKEVIFTENSFLPQLFYDILFYSSWSCQAAAELRLISQKQGVPHFTRKTNHVYTAKENDWGYSCFMTWAVSLNLHSKLSYEIMHINS